MKKWLTGLLSGSSEVKKKGQKEMSKSKPAKPAASKTKKAVKPAAKASQAPVKAAAKAKTATKMKTEAKVKTATKPKMEAKAKSVVNPKTEAKVVPESDTQSEAAAKLGLKVKSAPTDLEAEVAPPKTKAKGTPAKEKAEKPVKEKKPKKGAAELAATSPENLKKWVELHDKLSGEKAPSYSMSAQFEAGQPLEHKVLGWGYIVTNNNDRLEVLFESGVKILISNYKG